MTRHLIFFFFFVLHISNYGYCIDQTFDMQLIVHPFSIPKPTDEVPSQSEYILAVIRKVQPNNETIVTFTILARNGEKLNFSKSPLPKNFILNIAPTEEDKKALQRALDLRPDGDIGPLSLEKLIFLFKRKDEPIEYSVNTTIHRMNGIYLQEPYSEFDYTSLLPYLEDSNMSLPDSLYDLLKKSFIDLKSIKEATHGVVQDEHLLDEINTLKTLIDNLTNQIHDVMQRDEAKQNQSWSLSSIKTPQILIPTSFSLIVLFLLWLKLTQHTSHIKETYLKSKHTTFSKNDIEKLFRTQDLLFKDHFLDLKTYIQENLPTKDSDTGREQTEQVTEIPSTPPKKQQDPLSDSINTVHQKYLNQFHSILNNYKEGVPRRTLDCPNSALLLLNFMGLCLQKWKADLEKKCQFVTFENNKNPQILSVVDRAYKQIALRIADIRKGKISIEPLPKEAMEGLSLTEARTRLDVELDTLQQQLSQHENELAVDCDMDDHEDFMQNLILDTLFNEVGRLTPQVMPQPLLELLQLIRFRVQPIDVGQTDADSRYHDINRTRNIPGKEGKVVEVLMPGLCPLNEPGLIRKAVVIRGE